MNALSRFVGKNPDIELIHKGISIADQDMIFYEQTQRFYLLYGSPFVFFAIQHFQVSANLRFCLDKT